MQCEMCGTEGKLKKTKVEGAVLRLCEECQEAGEVMEKSSSSRSSSSRSKKRSGKKKRRSRKEQKELISGFGSVVKQAREAKDLSIAELADKINEKDSVVQRIESGNLKPNERLAGKLKNHLGVKLYESVSDVEYEARDASSNSSGGATIGDIADVKRKDKD